MSEYELNRLIKDKKKAEIKGNLNEVAETCNAIGEIYSKLGRYDDAIDEHQMELRISEALDDTVGVAVAHRKIGECHCDLAEYEKALEHQQLHLKLAERVKSDIEMQRAYATIGRTHLLQAESLTGNVSMRALTKAEVAFLKSLEVCQILKGKVDASEYMQMKCRLLLNLGIVSDQKGDQANCTELLKQAIGIANTSNLHEELYRCNYTLCDIYERLNNPSQALRSIEMALKTTQKTKDKSAEWDAVERKARIFVQLKDYVAASKCLKKTLKAKPPTGGHKQQLETVLKAVRRLRNYSEKLSATANDHHQGLFHLSEKMGDQLANLRLFRGALQFYHVMLKHAQTLNKSPSELIPVYVSLAQTYKDDKQYKKAAIYFRKELECRENDHEQACRTLLNIAETQELAKEEYPDIKESYCLALKEASRSKNKKLQFQVLKSLSIVQKLFDDNESLPTTKTQLDKLMSTHGYSLDDELSDQESQERENDSDDSLEDFTDTDTSDEEFGTEKTEHLLNVGRARRTTANVKRNEKGETPLHRACIDGKLKIVKTLVEKGHPVNPRDHCGWLPLHEAANHGHTGIVECLLANGAWINDRGGSQCGGVTAIHDAANCGHTAIVQLLVQKGANVHSKDDEGNTPLDCLRAFRQRTQDDLGRTEIAEIISIERLLKRTMNGNNPHLSSNHGQNRTSIDEDYDDEIPELSPRRKRGQRRPSSQRHDYTPTVHQDGNDEADSETIESVLQPDLSSLDQLQDPSTASMAYRDAMRELGSAASRSTQKETVQKAAVTGPALLYEEEVVDDWLIDDVRSNKRKLGDVEDVFKGTKVQKKPRTSTEIKDNTSSRRSSKGNTGHSESENMLENQTIDEDTPHESRNNNRMSSIGMDDIDSLFYDDDNGEHQPHVPKTSTQRIRKNKLSRQTTLSQFTSRVPSQSSINSVSQSAHGLSQTSQVSIIPSSSTSNTTQPSTVLRFRVKIKEKVFLVPIQQSSDEQCISLLAKEAADRYYKQCNLRPVLSIMKDGALLSPDEPIGLVLVNNEEVEGVVDSWDLPPLSTRYADACKTVGTTVYRNIRNALQCGEGNQILSLQNLALKPVQFLPITRALQCQNLKELYLKGNRLVDTGLQHLTKVLNTLASLTVLDLSSNHLTCVSLKSLVDCFGTEDDTSWDKPLQCLQTLNLSNNPFGDTSTPLLVKLLSHLPNLVKFHLAACDLTLKFFQDHRISLANVLKGHGLQHLDISYNNIGTTGLELLLTCVNRSELLSLNFSGVIRSFTGNNVTKHLERYLCQPGCVLQDITIDACSINPDHVDDLCRILNGAKSLCSLSISAHPKLSLDDLRQFVQASVDSQSVQSLVVNGCNFQGSLSTDFLDSISSKLYSAVPLKRFEFEMANSEGLKDIDLISIKQMWTDVWKEKAICEFVENAVRLLYLKD